MDFSDALEVLVGAMTRGNDFFTRGKVEMRTPVGHHSVRAMNPAPLSSVSDHGVNKHSIACGKIENGEEKWGPSPEKADAIDWSDKEIPHVGPHRQDDRSVLVSELSKRQSDEIRK